MADLPIVKRQQRASQAGREPAVALPPSLSSLPWLSQLLPSTTVARPPPSASPRHFSPTATQVDSLQTCSPTSSDGTFPSVASVAFFVTFTLSPFFSSFLPFSKQTPVLTSASTSSFQTYATLSLYITLARYGCSFRKISIHTEL